MKRSFKRTIFILILFLFISILLAIAYGAVKIPFNKLFSFESNPIIYLRLARIVMAILTGFGLACCGIVLQAILRNPLAEPYLLGTSSGAGLGAVIAIILGLSWASVPVASFLGAILSIILVYALAKERNRISQQSLILSGVMVSVALSAIIIFLISVSGNEALHGVTWWLWGNLQVYDFKLLLIASIVVILGVITIYVFYRDLNAISLGEEEAIHLGIDIEKVKKILLLVCALITACLVSISGVIGFVGLMIPHMMRFVSGPNHKTLIPLSCIAAAIFMVLCDLLSRSLLAPVEIPIGVITAIIGVPIFIILLKKSQRIK